MILSHKFKFIFIKTAKTAGTSIEIYLSKFCGEQDVVTPIFPEFEAHVPRNHKALFNPVPETLEYRGRKAWYTLLCLYRRDRFYNHIPANIVKCRISPEVWTKYFKFCVERNPWDKTVSHFQMLKHRSNGTLSLEQYLNRGDFCINYPLYTNRRGEIIVDEIIKYENLLEGLDRVFRRIGVPYNGELGVNAKSEYNKERRSYQEVFKGGHRAILQKAFKREISMHGYLF